MKKCTKCKVEKEFNCFHKKTDSVDGLASYCKECKKEISNKYYKDNKEKFKEISNKYKKNNKEKIKQRNKEYRTNNKEYNKEYFKKYYKNNTQIIKNKTKEYKKNNKEKTNKYLITRRKTDPLFKMQCYLRSRTSMAFKSKGYTKNTKTQEMLGIHWEVCKVHVEQQFIEGMDWENYGDWHIDHIVPLSCADTEEELKFLCHYTNLQPLWAVDNLAKSNTYIKEINYSKVLKKHPEPEILNAIVNRSQIVIL